MDTIHRVIASFFNDKLFHQISNEITIYYTSIPIQGLISIASVIRYAIYAEKHIEAVLQALKQDDNSGSIMHAEEAKKTLNINHLKNKLKLE